MNLIEQEQAVPAAAPVISIEPPARLTPLRSRAFWGIMIAFLVHGFVVSTWVSRIASIKHSLGLSDGVLGFCLLGAAIGSLIAIPVTGALLIRFGSRSLTKWSLACFCLALAPLALAWNAATLFLALFLYGIFAGANDVSMNSQAVGTEKSLGSAIISRIHGMFSFGGIIGSAAGGLIASRGVSSVTHLAAGTALFLLVSGFAIRLLPEIALEEKPGSHKMLRRLPPALLALSILGFCIFLSEGAIADWTAVYLRQVLGASEGLAPVGYAVFSAAMAVFRFSGDAITTRIGRAATIRYGALIAAVGLALAVTVQSPALALVGFAAAGVGFSSIIPLVFAAGGRIPSVNAGAGVATVSGIGYLGFLVGPPTIGMISELSSLRVGLSLLVVLSACAALLVSVVQRGSDGTTGPLADY